MKQEPRFISFLRVLKKMGNFYNWGGKILIGEELFFFNKISFSKVWATAKIYRGNTFDDLIYQA